jgi:hypothetical protein
MSTWKTIVARAVLRAALIVGRNYRSRTVPQASGRAAGTV